MGLSSLSRIAAKPLSAYERAIIGVRAPIARWKLDDPLGASFVKDSGPLGINGTPTSVTFGAASLAPNLPGTAATFNGTSSTISIPGTNFSFERTQKFAYGFWVKPNMTRTGTPPQNVVISKYVDDSNPGYEFRLVYNGFFPNATAVGTTLSNVSASSRVQGYTQTTDLTNSAAFHVMITYDGTSVGQGLETGNCMRVFVNGQPELVKYTSDNLSATILNASALNIGSRAGSSLWGSYTLQDLCVYDYCPNNASEIYAAGTGNYTARAIERATRTSAPPLIIDSDLYTDCDDVGAMNLANFFASHGECSLVAVNLNTSWSTSPGCVSAINTFWTRPSVPIGVNQASFKPTGGGAFQASVNAAFSSASSTTDAIAVYRQALANVADGTAVIASIGFLQNIQGLLQSAGDGIDARNGVALVTAKVNRLVVMGGVYDANVSTGNANNAEYNFFQNPSPANYVFANWPTTVPIYCLGYEVGFSFLTGQGLASLTAHPGKTAYSVHGHPGGRASWDPIAVYFAVRGCVFNDTTILSLVQGTNSVNASTGANTFTPSGSGPHYYVRKVMADADLSTYLDSVISASPILYLGQVATKSRIPTNTSTTNKQFNSRSHHVARSTITSVQIELPNWYWSRKGDLLEHGSGGNITYTASIEYPAGTFTQVKFSGSSSVVVSTNTARLSDALSVTIPDGSSFWVRVFATAATGIVFLDGETSPVSPQCDASNGEAMAFAASGLSDQTMSGTITATVGTTAAPIFSPTAIIAYTVKPSVLLIGDSRAWGYYDQYDSSGDLGELGRSIGPYCGYINAGSAGDNMVNFISSHTNRVALKQYVSHVITENGINDLRSGGSGLNQSSATAFANLQTLWGYFSDKKIFGQTISPNSSSTDAFVTVGNQTPNANATNIAAYNDLIRATPSPLLGYFEVADTLESARNSGKWKANQTTDGLHANPTGYQTVKTSGAVDPTRLKVV